MRIALINSGLGLLAVGAALHRLQPDAELILASDPDGMPWGPRTPAGIEDRAMLCARACAEYEPDVLVMACNTGSVHALGALRAAFEPAIAVIGTVPAIKPAAATHDAIAIWATVATTESAYQRQLIADFGGSADITPVACPGLADAVDAGDDTAIAAAIASAAARTPAGCQAVVLGCTEYELVGDRIAAAVPGAVTLGSAAAVAAQALRRARSAGLPATVTESSKSPGTPAGLAGSRGLAGSLGLTARLTGSPDTPAQPTRRLDTAAEPDGSPDTPAEPTSRHDTAAEPDGSPDTPADPTDSPGTPADPTGRADAAAARSRPGTVRVLLSGRHARLPAAAMLYPEGRLLAPLVLAPAERDRALLG